LREYQAARIVVSHGRVADDVPPARQTSTRRTDDRDRESRLIVPSHWAEARASLKVGGSSLTLRRFGWSDDSPADAQAQAELRVAEAARRAASGEQVPRREPKLAYNGAEGVPIREEVLARHGEAVITRNAYGARCLNVPDLLIADVDLESRSRGGLGWFGELMLVCAGIAAALPFHVGLTAIACGVAIYLAGSALLRLLRQQSASSGAERAAQRIHAFMARHADWRLRVYRTPAGLRLIATHARFAPASEATQAFFKAVDVDPVYARMCLNQRCFRARLSAKPWRIGIADHLKPRPGVWPIRPERLPARGLGATLRAGSPGPCGLPLCRDPGQRRRGARPDGPGRPARCRSPGAGHPPPDGLNRLSNTSGASPCWSKSKSMSSPVPPRCGPS
jgi:hypothetical protein